MLTIPNDLEVNCISVNNSLIFHLSKSDDKKEKEKEEIRMKVIYFNLISYKTYMLNEKITINPKF